MIRTCENEATPASDQLLKDTILEGGWIASDCESLFGDDENENRNNLPPDPEPELESPPAPLDEPHPPNNEDAVPEEHVPEAEERVDDVSPPILKPHVNSEGHRNICSILLPQLFWVMKDPRFAGRSPRDQVREACDRHMATVQVYILVGQRFLRSQGIPLQFQPCLLKFEFFYAELRSCSRWSEVLGGLAILHQKEDCRRPGHLSVYGKIGCQNHDSQVGSQ